MVCGWKPVICTVTANSLSVGTVSSQGVRQVCPWEVRASAPGGSDSIRSTSVLGVDLKKSKLGIDIEHAARAKPHPTAAITRYALLLVMLLMVIPPPARRPKPPICPQKDHRGAAGRAQPWHLFGGLPIAAQKSLKCGEYKVNYRLTFCRNSPFWPARRAKTASGRCAKLLTIRSGPSSATGVSL